MEMRSDGEETRKAMRQLLRVIEEVRRRHPRMELGQLAVLLSVLAEPGMWAKDLTAKVGVQKSALSRNVKALSNVSYLTDENGNPRDGMDLITQIPDVIDRRAFQLAPTRKGVTLAEKLSELMKG
jgi:DNA-binding MarR family transcriptional regulator